MTTTDYSRALCEICGIKPEIIEDYDGNEFEIYPDFTKPENFVKLLGLNVSARYRSLMHYITSIFCNTCSVEDFLEQLCLELHHYSESDIVKNIKQGIREQEWSYE